MIFLDGAWSIITLPVGKNWDYWQPINNALREKARKKSATKSPSAAILDAQTVEPTRSTGL